MEEKDEEKGVNEKEEWWEEEEYDEDLDYYETEDNNDRKIFHKLHKKSFNNILFILNGKVLMSQRIESKYV